MSEETEQVFIIITTEASPRYLTAENRFSKYLIKARPYDQEIALRHVNIINSYRMMFGIRPLVAIKLKD